MEFIGVPLVALIRALGPPAVVLAVGAVLIVLRRPFRAGLLWGALGVQFFAAALPYLWLLLQAGTGIAGQTWVGLVMILVQPGVEFIAWMLVFAAVFARRPGPPAEPADAEAARIPAP